MDLFVLFGLAGEEKHTNIAEKSTNQRSKLLTKLVTNYMQ
jgi:hypothetical protein